MSKLVTSFSVFFHTRAHATVYSSCIIHYVVLFRQFFLTFIFCSMVCMYVYVLQCKILEWHLDSAMLYRNDCVTCVCVTSITILLYVYLCILFLCVVKMLTTDWHIVRRLSEFNVIIYFRHAFFEAIWKYRSVNTHAQWLRSEPSWQCHNLVYHKLAFLTDNMHTLTNKVFADTAYIHNKQRIQTWSVLHHKLVLYYDCSGLHNSCPVQQWQISVFVCNKFPRLCTCTCNLVRLLPESW